MYGIIKEDSTEIDQGFLKKAYYYLDLFNEDLKRTKYAAGDCLTVADISLLCTIKSIECTGFWDLEKYHQIHAWIQSLKKELKNWDTELEQPNTQYGVFIRQKLEANKATKADKK